MVTFSATIQQFDEQGEKTGWTYIVVPPDAAGQLSPGSRKSFRVKGLLDGHAVEGMAVLPMGDGSFILTLNAALRRTLKKKKGAMLQAALQPDKSALTMPEDFKTCLEDEPAAAVFFSGQPLSHRNYFIKWIAGVKSEEARARRIARAVTALARRMNFAEMIRQEKAERQQHPGW